jgi:RNA polymerase sigma-32 factor
MAKKENKNSGKKVLPVLEAEVIVEKSPKKGENKALEVVKKKPSGDSDLLLPILSSTELTVPGKDADPLTLYLKQIARYELLSPEQEQELTSALLETGDIEVAKKLVVANLRLVVKIAMEYRTAWQNVMDLIQEGNLGLMKAVSKYDASKGAKLSYYASWWIRSYILKFLLDNFRMVKIGTTNDQKKLFYNLMREKERLMAQGITPDTKMLSENLGVSEKSVETMTMRLGSRGSEVSLDANLDSDSDATILDMMATDELGPEEKVAIEQEHEILRHNMQEFLKSLKPRDLEIFKKRLLSEVPPSLQEIADEYGVSRERIRQIEERLVSQLKVYMSDHIR